MIEFNYSDADMDLANFQWKKLRRLLHKKRDVREFVWKGIRKNTPLSSKIYCYKKCTNSRLKRYKGKNVSFFQRESKKWVPKRGKVYLWSKYQRWGCLTAMKYGNKILRKYLSLCTCNFPISDHGSLSHRVNCDKLKLCYDVEKNPRPSPNP